MNSVSSQRGHPKNGSDAASGAKFPRGPFQPSGTILSTELDTAADRLDRVDVAAELLDRSQVRSTRRDCGWSLGVLIRSTGMRESHDA